MSAIKKMMDKTAGLRSASDVDPSSVRKAGPVTAPGMMAQLSGAQSRIKALEDQLATGGVTQRLPLEVLSPNPWQPRKKFKPEALATLAMSIKEQGVMQPILVRLDPKNPGRYQIAAGERRYRASGLAGLVDIPVRIVELTDEEMALWALGENLNREDLTDFEISLSIKSMQSAFSEKTKLAECLGFSRAQLYRYLAYGDLPSFVLADLEEDPSRLTVTYVGQVVELMKHEALGGSVFREVWDSYFQKKIPQEQLILELHRRTKASQPGNELPQISELRKNGKKVGRIQENGKTFSVRVQLSALSPEQQQGLRKYIEALLK